MANKKKVTRIVEEMLENFLADNGYELYNVEFVKEGRDWFLRVYVDRAWAEAKGLSPAPQESIGTDDCEKISRFLSDKLDEVDPIEQNYYLEVSSPGLDRDLIKDRDFLRYAGRAVVLKLYQPYEGSKTVEGKLVSREDGMISVEDASGVMVRLSEAQVAKTSLKLII
ncbi:MAG: ribosome maturation factor RimP [Clostridiales Family XIII bacterium]|jgi:ribosome maturation factor RimP|nr:ribosome maturation factor RimP [Clostridiales Family XIII bacterium]